MHCHLYIKVLSPPAETLLKNSLPPVLLTSIITKN